MSLKLEQPLLDFVCHLGCDNLGFICSFASKPPTPLPSNYPGLPMQTAGIVNFAIVVSIGMQFLQGSATETRLVQFEQLAAAAAALIQHIGRPPFMLSMYNLWLSVRNCLAVFEKAVFPDQNVQTSRSLPLPPRNRPLSAVMTQHISSRLHSQTWHGLHNGIERTWMFSCTMKPRKCWIRPCYVTWPIISYAESMTSNPRRKWQPLLAVMKPLLQLLHQYYNSDGSLDGFPTVRKLMLRCTEMYTVTV